MIEPVFESLASEKGIKSGGKGGAGAAFTKIDLGVGLGNNVAGQWGVRVTPTFIFFLDGKKVFYVPYLSVSCSMGSADTRNERC